MEAAATMCIWQNQPGFYIGMNNSFSFKGFQLDICPFKNVLLSYTPSQKWHFRLHVADWEKQRWILNCLIYTRSVITGEKRHFYTCIRPFQQSYGILRKISPFFSIVVLIPDMLVRSSANARIGALLLITSVNHLFRIPGSFAVNLVLNQRRSFLFISVKLELLK